MSILILTSAGGSPGVTTLGIGLALTWPRPVLLADCDPGAHQAVLAGYLAGQSGHGKGLLRVAEAHRDRRFASPYVALKGSKGEQIQIIQLDLAKMTVPNMTRQHALAGVVRRGLGELTGAGDIAAANVEPVAGETPLRDRCHWMALRKDAGSL